MNALQGLYLVTPDWDDTEKLLAVSKLALQGGARLLQYRHKSASPALRYAQASALHQLCKQFRVPFIINDHVQLCLDLDAQGIHVGGQDLSVAEVRALVGTHKIVGASCYGDLMLAQQAVAAGASYVAFGGFYPSRIKQYEVKTVPSILSEASALFACPKVVIGGMTLDNSRPLVEAGAQMVAAISSVYFAHDPRAAAQALVALPYQSS